MKYICTSDFPNPPGKPIVIEDVRDESGKVVRAQSHVLVGGKPAKEHVHKGAVFTIGTASEFKDLSPADRTLVAQLFVSKKIKDATPANIKAIDEEVAADKKRAERDAEAADKLRGPTAADILAQLPDLIAQSVATAVASIKK